VAQRELANRSFETAEPLLGRSDVDPGIRAQIINNLTAWSASGVVTAGTVTAPDVERLLDQHPDSTDLLVAAPATPMSEGSRASCQPTLLLPVILAKDPRHSLTGYQANSRAFLLLQ
jgi:hypothetical protein